MTTFPLNRSLPPQRREGSGSRRDEILRCPQSLRSVLFTSAFHILLVTVMKFSPFSCRIYRKLRPVRNSHFGSFVEDGGDEGGSDARLPGRGGDIFPRGEGDKIASRRGDKIGVISVISGCGDIVLLPIARRSAVGVAIAVAGVVDVASIGYVGRVFYF